MYRLDGRWRGGQTSRLVVHVTPVRWVVTGRPAGSGRPVGGVSSTTGSGTRGRRRPSRAPSGARPVARVTRATVRPHRTGPWSRVRASTGPSRPLPSTGSSGGRVGVGGPGATTRERPDVSVSDESPGWQDPSEPVVTRGPVCEGSCLVPPTQNCSNVPVLRPLSFTQSRTYQVSMNKLPVSLGARVERRGTSRKTFRTTHSDVGRLLGPLV